jgi:hypothetical protein
VPGACVLVKLCTPQLSLAVGAVHVAVLLQTVLPVPVLTLMLAGQPAITGTVLSATVTVKLQVLVLPAASVKVYVTGVTPTGKVAPGLCVLLTATVPGQLSVAVGAVQLAVWLQAVLPVPVATLMLEGQPAITGTVLSVTVTVKLQVLLLPARSIEVYTTVVVPTGNTEPGACVVVSVGRPRSLQLSDVVGAVQLTGVLHCVLPAPVFTDMLEGQPLITGAVESLKNTVNVQLDVLPFTSVTNSVNGMLATEAPMIVPTGILCVTPAMPQASVAVTLNRMSGKVLVQSGPFTIMVSAKQLTTGATRSRIRTVEVQVCVLPAASVTVKVTVFNPTLAQVKVLGETLNVTPEQLSKLPLLICEAVMLALPVASRFTFKMVTLHIATGLVKSSKFKVKLDVLVLPQASVANTTMVLVPP